MFNKELFYSLCEKYEVELSRDYNRPMMRTEKGLVRELIEEDVKELVPKYQTYFKYKSLKGAKEIAGSKTYVFEELLTAC